MKWLRELKTALLTALLVFIAMQVLVDIVRPFVPLVLTILVLAAIGGYLYFRVTRL